MRFLGTARCAAAVLLAVVALAPWSPAYGIPRYSALYGQNCHLCHINPTGGGQRTAYAVQFLVPTEMSARSYSPEDAAAKFDPQLGRNLSIGLDFRTIHHYTERKDVGYDNFTLMEGSVYLTYRLNERFLVSASRGETVTTSEIFGLAYVLPLSGVLKAGWFLPDFGWRWDDHTMFTRLTPMKPSNSLVLLGGAPVPARDVGVEASIYPGKLMLTASVTNGNLGNTLDNNRKVALTTSALYRQNLAGIGMGLGGSFWYNDEPYPGGPDRTSPRRAGGPHAYLDWKAITWVGEADWSKGISALALESVSRTDSTAAPAEKTHFTTSQELAVRILRGFELRGTYDFHDPDIHEKSGARARYGGGFSYMPYPFLSIQLMINRNDFIPGTLVRRPGSPPAAPNLAVRPDYTQSEAQLLFFF